MMKNMIKMAKVVREKNKLNTIKDIKRFMGKDEQISVEELNKKIKDGISLADISATF